MSSTPIVRQTRRSFTLADGSVRYEVVNEIVAQGDLPFRHLFVLKVGANADPTDDVFARIATPADIRQATESAPIFVKVVSTDLVRISSDQFVKVPSYAELTRLPRDRTYAYQNGLPYYLSTTAAFVYDNVTTADAAAKQLLDRLSELVREWRQYNVAFVTNPYVDLSLPRPASSVESERTALFVEARTARTTAEAARDAAAAAKEACERDCAPTKTIYTWLVTQVAKLEAAQSVVAAIAETSGAKDFVLKQGSYVSDSRSYKDLLLELTAQRDSYATEVQACAVRCAQLGATLLEQQQAVDAAKRAEDAALANVVAVCPTFNPDSV